MEGKTQEVLLLTEDGYRERDVAQAVETALEEYLSLETETRAWKDLNMMYSFLSIAKFIYYVMGAIFFVLGSTVIINTTMMVIYERIREIGTLGALGMQGKELTRLFLLEGTFISIAGSTLGTLVGVLIVFILSKTGINFTEAMSGVDMEISSIPFPAGQLVHRTVCVDLRNHHLITLYTHPDPRKASKIQIVEALRYV